MNDLIEILAEKLCNLSEDFIILNCELDSTDKVNYNDLDDYDKEFYRFQVEVIFNYIRKFAIDEVWSRKYKDTLDKIAGAKTIWTVTAHRKFGEHIYLVASFSSEENALKCANNHEIFRDGKYYCKITKQDIDTYSDYKELFKD